MKGPLSESEMGAILVHAKLAAKNVRAQRDRLLQFQLQLEQPALTTPTGDGAALLLKNIASGLVDVCYSRIEMGARSLATSIRLVVKYGVAPSLPLEFGEIPDEELFDRLVALRLFRRPVTQFQAFARVEAAYYAVKCIQEHFLPRCVERLGYPYRAYGATDDRTNDDDDDSEDSLPYTDHVDSQDGGEVGLPDPVTAAANELLADCALPDPVAAVAEDLAKIGLSDTDANAATKNLAKIGLPDPPAAATEPREDSSKIYGLRAPAASATGDGETLQAASIDMDQARTFLDRACTLANLAVKHIDLAVTTITSFADQKEVAGILNFVDRLDYT